MLRVSCVSLPGALSGHHLEGSQLDANQLFWEQKPNLCRGHTPM